MTALVVLAVCGACGAAESTTKAPRDEQAADAAQAADGGGPDARVASETVDAGEPPLRDAQDAQDAQPTEPETLQVCGRSVRVSDYAAVGSELIIDVNTLAFPPLTEFFGQDPRTPHVQPFEVPWLSPARRCDYATCFDRSDYMQQIFERSDTAMALRPGLPYALPADDGGGAFDALTNPALFESVQWANDRLGARRVLFAPAVMPNDRLDLQLSEMHRWAATGEVAAWLVDPAWPAPSRPGLSALRLDDPQGTAVIEQGIALGLPIFLVPKGMPRADQDPAFTGPADIGPSARAHPGATFIVLHAAFDQGLQEGESSVPDLSDPDRDLGWGAGVGIWPEGPYDEEDEQVRADYPLDRGVNSLIHALREAGVAPGENVHAAIDGLWPMLLTRPDQAAHALGKLLLYLGEDNVLWGTQSVVAGGPAQLIEAFRQFEIPQELQDRHGYPALTAQRKAKILGLNAARIFCIDPSEARAFRNTAAP